MNNKPTHNLVLITEGEKKTQFTTLCALWPTNDETGYTGEIPEGLTLTGKIGVFPIKGKDKPES